MATERDRTRRLMREERQKNLDRLERLLARCGGFDDLPLVAAYLYDHGVRANWEVPPDD